MKSIKLIGAQTYTYGTRKFTKDSIAMVQDDLAETLLEKKNAAGEPFFCEDGKEPKAKGEAKPKKTVKVQPAAKKHAPKKQAAQPKTTKNPPKEPSEGGDENTGGSEGDNGGVEV